MPIPFAHQFSDFALGLRNCNQCARLRRFADHLCAPPKKWAKFGRRERHFFIIIYFFFKFWFFFGEISLFFSFVFILSNFYPNFWNNFLTYYFSGKKVMGQNFLHRLTPNFLYKDVKKWKKHRKFLGKLDQKYQRQIIFAVFSLLYIFLIFYF